MIDNIVIFNGSRKDFEKLIEDRIDKNDETIPFMDLIQHYNARLRPINLVLEKMLCQKK